MVATEHAEANLRSLRYFNATFDMALIIYGDYAKEKGFVTHHLAQLQKMKRKVATLHLADGIDFKNVHAIKRSIETWLDENQPKRVIFNNTGGSKLTAIAIDRITQERQNCNAYYQSINDTMLWYDFAPEQRYEFAIAPQNDIATRLQDAGFEIKNSDVMTMDVAFFNYANELMKIMADDYEYALKFISYINKQLHNKQTRIISDNQVANALVLDIDNNRYFQTIADIAQATNQQLFRLYDTNKLFIEHPEAHALMQGGWLEIFTVYCSATTSGVDFSQVSLNVEIIKDDLMNEIDVVLSKEQKLFLFECKTVNFSRKHDKNMMKLNDIIYKLSHLTRKIGLQAHPVIVSLHSVNDAILSRAKVNDIEVIHGKQMVDLSKRLQQLINR